MCTCSNCFEEKSVLVYLPLYGYICSNCYPDVITDYLK